MQLTAISSWAGDPAEFPNSLAAPSPLTGSRPWRPWLLLLLVLIAMAPRALMAWKLDVICTDGALYLELAKALDQGELLAALKEMNLNVYPVVLVAMHRLGFGWEQGAEIWGVLAASLAVLPLFGWVRRQFDDRIAAIACLFYAVHPKLIGWSPEIIRDPTFWLLFTLGLYLTWKAVTEVSLIGFVAAGSVITLASLTRVEGLFLIIPMSLWTFSRFRALRTARGRLLLGGLLSLTALPAFVLLINVTLLRNHPRWEGIRTTPLVVVQKWATRLMTGIAGSNGQTAANEQFTAAQNALRDTERPLLFTYFRTIERGLMPHVIILIFTGAWYWRRVGNRCDQRPCMYLTLAILVGIWIHLGIARQSSSRYALPIVILTAPYTALGLLFVADLVARSCARLATVNQWRTRTCAGLLSLVAIYGTCDALLQDYGSRRDWANLGRWIGRTYGEQAMVVGSHEMTSIVRYYAHARYQVLPSPIQADDAVKLLRTSQPDVVVVTASHMHGGDRKTLIREGKSLGLEELDRPMLSSDRSGYVILAKTPTAPVQF